MTDTLKDHSRESGNYVRESEWLDGDLEGSCPITQAREDGVSEEGSGRGGKRVYSVGEDRGGTHGPLMGMEAAHKDREPGEGPGLRKCRS